MEEPRLRRTPFSVTALKPFEGNKDAELYNSRKWRNFRKEYLRNHPICLHCEDEGSVRPAQVVDHIKPVRLGGEIYDVNNLQALCHNHHNKKSAKERHGKG
jgi:5-methylcytosine-specific restriction enzyme A